MLNKATSVDPSNPDVYLKLGIGPERLGNNEAAVLAWQKYLRAGSQRRHGRGGQGADRQAQPEGDHHDHGGDPTTTAPAPRRPPRRPARPPRPRPSSTARMGLDVYTGHSRRRPSTSRFFGDGPVDEGKRVNLSISADVKDSAVVIRVEGDLDVYTAPRLKEALEEAVAGGKRLVLDLSEVHFIDSTALGVLVGALQQSQSSGGEFRLVVDDPYLAQDLSHHRFRRDFLHLSPGGRRLSDGLTPRRPDSRVPWACYRSPLKRQPTRSLSLATHNHREERRCQEDRRHPGQGRGQRGVVPEGPLLPLHRRRRAGDRRRGSQGPRGAGGLSARVLGVAQGGARRRSSTLPW